MDKIEKIRQEIKRLKAITPEEYSECPDGYILADDVLDFIESIEGTEVAIKVGDKYAFVNSSLESLEQIPQPKIKGWVARDKEGVLCFHYEKPYRFRNVWESTEDFEDRKQIVLEFEPNRYFPNLKWEDEPLKVELTINATPDVIKIDEPEVDLEKAALNFANEIGVPVSNTFLSIARHFYELGQQRRIQIEGLDEAADKYESQNSLAEDYCGALAMAFKAGAEWMANQGETINGSLCYGPHLQKVIVFLEDCPKMWEGRTMDVIVQIRKKEESK